MSKVRLSSRAIEMPASPIRRLVPYADRAKARGVKVYHLNIGQPDIETPAEMMNGYRNVNIKVLSYGPSQGLQDYIDALVQYYGRVGIKVRAQDILVTTGGSEAISFALDVVADAGDEVIVPAFTFVWNALVGVSALDDPAVKVKLFPVIVRVASPLRLASE